MSLHLCKTLQKHTIAMIIKKDKIDLWKAISSPGDASKMVEMYGEGAYPEMFHRALRLGKGNDKVVKVMEKFFKNKVRIFRDVVKQSAA